MGKVIQLHLEQCSDQETEVKKVTSAINRLALIKRETVEEIHFTVSELARKRHFAVRQSSVSEATDAELIQWINSSSRLEWKQHPSFYMVVIQEARKRWTYLR